MAPASILDVCTELGIRVQVIDGGLAVTPASHMNNHLRGLLREHKPEVIKYLEEEQRIESELLEAAMSVCDRYGDGDEAREEMRRDCLALHRVFREDLLSHFRRQAPTNFNF